MRASPPLATPSPARPASPPSAAEAAEAAAEEAAEAAAEEEEAAAAEAAEVSPDAPDDLVGRTLSRSTESFSILDVAVRLVGRGAGACVRVPIRRAWEWSVCLAEVQSRLLEASAIGEDEQVVALRATAPPHARVVRAADLAPGELLEALLSAAAGSAAEGSPRGSAREYAEDPEPPLPLTLPELRQGCEPPPRREAEGLEEEEASNLVRRRPVAAHAF